MMWVEKYRPQKAEDMVGNEESRTRFMKWLDGWEQGTKPILLVGPPGTGKTTLVHVGARQLGYFVIELNASDVRTKEALKARLGALTSESLVEERRLLFLDEVDGLSARADYGGLQYLTDSLEELGLPIAMAANYEDSDQVKKLAKLSTVVKMRRVAERLIEIYVREILHKEGVDLPADVIVAAVRSAAGDVRAAVNNVQAVAFSGELSEGRRNQLITVADAITSAAFASDLEMGTRALRSSDSQPDEKLLAAYATISAADVPLDKRREALKALTEANVLLGRIKRTQRWRQLRYFDALLAQALAGLRVSFVSDDLPWPVKLRIWNDGKYIRAFESYLARRHHISRADAAAFYLHSAVLLYGKDRALLGEVCARAGLDEKAANALEREYKLLVRKVGE